LVTNRRLNQEVKLSAARYPEAIQALQSPSSPQLLLPDPWKEFRDLIFPSASSDTLETMKKAPMVNIFLDLENFVGLLGLRQGLFSLTPC